MEYILLTRQTNNELSLFTEPTGETKVFNQLVEVTCELSNHKGGVIVPLVNIIRLLEDIEIEISTLRAINKPLSKKSPFEDEIFKLAYGDGMGEYVILDDKLNLYGSGSYRESVFNLKQAKALLKTSSLKKGALIIPLYNIISLLKRSSSEIRKLMSLGRSEDLISSQRLKVRDRVEDIAF